VALRIWAGRCRGALGGLSQSVLRDTLYAARGTDHPPLDFYSHMLAGVRPGAERCLLGQAASGTDLTNSECSAPHFSVRFFLCGSDWPTTADRCSLRSWPKTNPSRSARRNGGHACGPTSDSGSSLAGALTLPSAQICSSRQRLHARAAQSRPALGTGQHES